MIISFRQKAKIETSEAIDLRLAESLITNAPLFTELTAEEQQAIGQWMQLEKYAPDQIIFARGDESCKLYLVQQGWVKLSNGSGNGATTSLSAGQLVGEPDFFLRRPYTVTARAGGQLVVWSLSSLALTEIIGERPEIGIKLGLLLGIGISQFWVYLARRLATVPFFQNLSEYDRLALAKYLAPHRFSPRETIYRSDDPPTGIFLIEQGKIWLLSDTDEQIDLLPGDLFGEKAVIAGKPHANTAQAATDVILWQLSPADFTRLASAHASIKTCFDQNLSARLTEALSIASMIVDGEIDAMHMVCGDQHSLIRKLHQVNHILTWLKNNQALL